MEPTFATPHAFFGLAEPSRERPSASPASPTTSAPRTGRALASARTPSATPAVCCSTAIIRSLGRSGKLPLADIGDFRIALGDVQASLRLIERQASGIAHLVALGGDHSVTLPLLRALARRLGPVGLVHFDAHVDTWPDSFGQAYGHGSPFFHAINEKLIDPRRTVQIGIRSPVQRRSTTGRSARA